MPLAVEMFSCVSHPIHVRGKRWRSWLRHCAASRKTAVSIPDGVI